MEYLNHVAVLCGLAVLAFEQVLKLKLVPLQIANKYPVPVLIVLSIAAAVVANSSDWVHAHSVGQWIQLVATIGLVAAFTYNHTFQKWSDLRAMEG